MLDSTTSGAPDAVRRADTTACMHARTHVAGGWVGGGDDRMAHSAGAAHYVWTWTSTSQPPVAYGRALHVCASAAGQGGVATQRKVLGASSPPPPGPLAYTPPALLTLHRRPVLLLLLLAALRLLLQLRQQRRHGRLHLHLAQRKVPHTQLPVRLQHQQSRAAGRAGHAHRGAAQADGRQQAPAGGTVHLQQRSGRAGATGYTAAVSRAGRQSRSRSPRRVGRQAGGRPRASGPAACIGAAATAAPSATQARGGQAHGSRGRPGRATPWQARCRQQGRRGQPALHRDSACVAAPQAQTLAPNP